MDIEVIQAKFKGYDFQAIEKDINKIAKRYMKMGNSEQLALEKAVDYVEYYKHTYRQFS